MSAAKNSWPRVRLGDVCEIVLGGTPKTTIDGYWNGVIPWITPGEMGKISGPYVSDTKRKLTAEGLAAGSRLFPEKSVILSTRAPIGYVFINAVPMCTNQGCKTLVPSDRLLAEYLYWNLRGRTDELNQLGTGTTFKELSTIALKSIELPLPPLSTQREIVARLEKELGQVDELAKKFAELETTAEAEFKATLKEMFDEISRRGAETRRLGEVCETSAGGTPLKTHREYYEGGKIPWLRSGEVCTRDITSTEMRITQLGVDNSSAKLFPKNTVVVAMYGATAGQVGILRLKATTNQAVCGIFPCEEIVPEFLYYKLFSLKDLMVSQAVGGAQPNISQQKVKSLIVPLPPLPVQREIVARLDAAKARKEALVDAAKRGLAEAAQMRKAILKEEFE